MHIRTSANRRMRRKGGFVISLPGGALGDLAWIYHQFLVAVLRRLASAVGLRPVWPRLELMLEANLHVTAQTSVKSAARRLRIRPGR
jgi:hypothetical protein